MSRCIYQQHMHGRIYLLPITCRRHKRQLAWKFLASCRVIVPALAEQVPSSLVKNGVDLAWIQHGCLRHRKGFCPRKMCTPPPSPFRFTYIGRPFSRTRPGHSTAAAPALTKKTTLRQRSASTLVRYTAGSMAAGRKRYALSHGSPFTSAARLIASSV